MIKILILFENLNVHYSETNYWIVLKFMGYVELFMKTIPKIK